MCFTLGMQLKLNFTVFLFKILERGFSFGKQCCSILKNSLPKLVSTLLQNGGLYHVIFLGLFGLPLSWIGGGHNLPHTCGLHLEGLSDMEV